MLSSLEYQKFIKAYISNDSPYRGIFLYYGLGSGKTRAAIEIARTFANEGNRCLFVSKAKLIYNFAKELAKWQWSWNPAPTSAAATTAATTTAATTAATTTIFNQGRIFTKRDYDIFTSIKRKEQGQAFLWDFGVGYAAYNANNKYNQLQRYADPKTNKLTNMVIIIDEIHNLVQQLHNGMNSGATKTRENQERYYRLFLDTVNCRFVTLSGTPIINLPSELAILFNLLRGPIPIPKNYIFDPNSEKQRLVKERGYFELFPIYKDVFEQYFVDYNNRTPININIFQRRIQGLVSYYSGAKGDIYPEMVDQNGNPTNGPVLIPVIMSETQTLWYEYVRANERSKKGNLILSSLEIDEALKDIELSSNFRVKSRLASNYGFPLDIINEVPKGKREKADIVDLLNILDKDSEKYFGQTLSVYSAKMAKIISIIDHIRDHESKKDGGILIYSNYREVEGIALMARSLIKHGYTQYLPGDEKRPNFQFDGNKFAILGSDDTETTQQIIEIYNSMENLFLPKYNNRNEFEHMIDEFGNMIDEFGNVIDQFGNVIDEFGNAIDEFGNVIDEFRNNIPYIGAGRIVKILLGTEIISEGIDLFNIRQVHIMEPHWNFVRIDQTIGRARRLCSHMNLPKELRTFTAYLYLSILDPNMNISGDKETTDQVIYRIALAKKQINDAFLQSIKEAALDCNLNSSHNNTETDKINCMVLPPITNHHIHAYYPNMDQDLEITSDSSIEILKKEKKKKRGLGIYSQKDFSFQLYPELWKLIITPMGKRRIEPRYSVETEADGTIIIEKINNDTARIILYDREAAISNKETIAVGYIELNKNKKPIIKLI